MFTNSMITWYNMYKGGERLMKKILALILLLTLLVACGNEDLNIEKMNNYINDIQKYSNDLLLGGNGIEELKETIDSYNRELKSIETKNDLESQFIDYQLAANKLRIDGITSDDGDMITESSKLQYYAIMLLEEMKK